jgi:hypothetical protein
LPTPSFIPLPTLDPPSASSFLLLYPANRDRNPPPCPLAAPSPSAHELSWWSEHELASTARTSTSKLIALARRPEQGEEQELARASSPWDLTRAKGVCSRCARAAHSCWPHLPTLLAHAGRARPPVRTALAPLALLRPCAHQPLRLPADSPDCRVVLAPCDPSHTAATAPALLHRCALPVPPSRKVLRERLDGRWDRCRVRKMIQ